MKDTKILFLSHHAATTQFQQFFTAMAELPSTVVKVILPKENIYQNGYAPLFWKKRKTVHNVEYIPSKLLDKKRYHLSGYFPELPLTILKFKPDVVVVTDEVYTIDALFVIIYKLLFFKKYQIITWSQAHYMEDASVLRSTIPWLQRFNRFFIHKFVARNKLQESRIQASLKKNEQVQHVYWNTNPEMFKPLPTTKAELLQTFKLPSDLATKKIIGFVGRIVPEKGITDAIQSLASQPEDVVFLIVGKGDAKYINEATQLAQELGLLNKRCFFVGEIEYSQLPEFYNLLDLFLLPTKNHNNFYELFGRVLAEAKMCKTIVLGSNNGAIPEVVANEECIFEQGNIKDLEHKITHLLTLDDAARDAMIEQHYQQALDNYSIQAFANNLNALITR